MPNRITFNNMQEIVKRSQACIESIEENPILNQQESTLALIAKLKVNNASLKYHIQQAFHRSKMQSRARYKTTSLYGFLLFLTLGLWLAQNYTDDKSVKILSWLMTVTDAIILCCLCNGKDGCFFTFDIPNSYDISQGQETFNNSEMLLNQYDKILRARMRKPFIVYHAPNQIVLTRSGTVRIQEQSSNNETIDDDHIVDIGDTNTNDDQLSVPLLATKNKSERYNLN